MRNFSIPLSVILVSLSMIAIACSGTDPIAPDPDAPQFAQPGFATHLTARFNSSTGEIFIGAPENWALPFSNVKITVPGEFPMSVRVFPNGSFLCRFTCDENSTAAVEWTDSSLVKHEETVSVSDPADGLESSLGSAGQYANRMTLNDNTIWVVNSGDDEFQSYNPDSLSPEMSVVTTPEYSNPWDAAFYSDSHGLITTLFSGVYQFNAENGTVVDVSTAGFRAFASPNGVAVAGEKGWVVNPNPISYFPSEFGQGWVSMIEPGLNPSVIGEINTAWNNPQNVITDGDRIYVSCSGTIDFLLPDYTATALDSGGVHVIDPESHQILKSYDLGMGGPGVMGLSPDGRYLYVGSGVAGSLFRIDLVDDVVLNDASNPIVISDFPGTFIPFIKVAESGLLVCASFNTDTIHFVNSYTGETDPFPFFEPIDLHPDDPGAFYGPQDAVFMNRNGVDGILILTTVESAFHWLPI